MCGQRPNAFLRFCFILCCWLLAWSLAAASQDPAQMTDSQILTELKDTLLLQMNLQDELRSKLTLLQKDLQQSGQRLDEAVSSSQSLSEDLRTVQVSLESLESRLTEQESRALTAQDSLKSTTGSLEELSNSLTSYYEETEREIRGLRTQNIVWTILTIISASAAITALVLN